MRLPEDNFEIVTEGAAALEALGPVLRAEAERHPDAPELWLVVRDIEGLAGRLTMVNRDTWELGFVGLTVAIGIEPGPPMLLVTGQDLGALDDLLANGMVANGQRVFTLSPSQREPLARLSAFLRRFLDGDFTRR